jgi:hypothetical protein
MEIWRDLIKVISIFYIVDQPETGSEHSSKELFEQLRDEPQQNDFFCWKTDAFGGKAEASFVEEQENSPKEFCQKCLKSQRSTESPGMKRQVVFAYPLLKNLKNVEYPNI